MKRTQKFVKWFRNKELEPTVLSPDLPLPAPGEVLEFKFSKKERIIIPLACCAFIAFNVFVIKSWFLPIIVMVWISHFFWKNWDYYNIPFLVIDADGLTYRKKFFPWKDIAATQIQKEGVEGGDSYSLVIGFRGNSRTLTIGLNGTKRPVAEISHYVEFFRMNVEATPSGGLYSI